MLNSHQFNGGFQPSFPMQSNPIYLNQGDDMHKIIYSVKGEVNGDSVFASGTASTSVNHEKFIGSLLFQEIPPSFDPAVTGLSILSISCGGFAEEIEGALSMLSLSGGNHEGFRSYTIQDPRGKIVGALVSILKMRNIGENLYKADVTICGTYKGPTNFVSIGGYQILMKQKSPGRIGGQYKQRIVNTDQEEYIIYASTEYVYNNNKTLPFPTVWTVEYQNANKQLTQDQKLAVVLNSKVTVQPYQK
ncbi:hypothetical protein PNF30_16175 [Bacillus safensis]|uniref:hypothetical protein n=1 Tax=Bacillus TaxID=1386 RepID=UPI00234313C7|nr:MULTISPECIES: hypothetical protein [Bacillus]MEC3814148.1 hypothetical protein [Bacillus altitudinis]WCL57017.1 hypothetical protein PNF30_16175 [Bacillus safensis]